MIPIDVLAETEAPPAGWRHAIYAKDQPEYHPLPVLVSDTYEGYVTSCWRPSWRERCSLIVGGRVWLTLMTFQRPLQPILVEASRRRPGWIADRTAA